MHGKNRRPVVAGCGRQDDNKSRGIRITFGLDNGTRELCHRYIQDSYRHSIRTGRDGGVGEGIAEKGYRVVAGGRDHLSTDESVCSGYGTTEGLCTHACVRDPRDARNCAVDTIALTATATAASPFFFRTHGEWSSSSSSIARLRGVGRNTFLRPSPLHGRAQHHR